ncbi:MAG: PAS domain-containing protein [Chitinophagaceae bacterium]
MFESIDFGSIFQSLPGNYIILLADAPTFTIVAFNETRAAETFTGKEYIGKGIFDTFPENLLNANANGVAMLSTSLETVMREKKPHQMAVQKFDIHSVDDYGFETRYWLPKNIPILNKDGEITYIIHHLQDLTTQINSEQRANLALQNFENFLNQANAPFAVLTGREFLFTYANLAYKDLMNNRQLEGKTVIKAIPELEGQLFIKQMQDVFDTGIPYHGIEVPAIAHFRGTDKPTTRFFNLSYAPYRDETGTIQGILAYAYDVSEQVALRKRDQHNQLNQQAYDLFMQAPVGICILKEPAHNIILANAPMLEIWGKDTSIIGKPLLDALPEILEQGFLEILDGVKATGQPFYSNEHLASLYRNGKKENVFINFVYQPYYEADGTINGVLAVATEVTAQIVARKKVEYAEETARLAIESADLGAYEINLLTDEMITTPRFNSIWGLDPQVDQALPRSSFANSIYELDRPRRLKAHKDSLHTGKLFYEARIIWKDESVHWVRVNGTVLFDAKHTPVRLLGVIQDITEQRAFAKEMNRLVSERTRELQNANERLEASNKELEQFAYITSHDLQEPIRKIQVFTSLLISKDRLNEDWQVYAEKIGDAAKRMSGLIKDLLEYSRLSQNTKEFGPVKLNDVLQDVLSDFDLLITQKKATIDADELDTVEAIPLQMNQLFSNLVGNSLKFSLKNASPVISIKAGRLSDEKKKLFPQLLQDRDYYEIIVSDRGIGFNQEYADKIFTVFQRLNQQVEYDGYGIGLALCSKVVANHHGIIRAEGLVNEGAKFTIILPYLQY